MGPCTLGPTGPYTGPRPVHSQAPGPCGTGRGTCWRGTAAVAATVAATVVVTVVGTVAVTVAVTRAGVEQAKP